MNGLYTACTACPGSGPGTFTNYAAAEQCDVERVDLECDSSEWACCACSACCTCRACCGVLVIHELPTSPAMGSTEEPAEQPPSAPSSHRAACSMHRACLPH